MKRSLFYFLLSFFSLGCFSQQFTVSFEASNDNSVIDSIYVKNLTKDQTLVLSAGESTVSFNVVTGIGFASLDDEINGCIYPNPFSQSTDLSFNTSKMERVVIEIYTMAGQLLYRDIKTVNSGNHQFSLSFPSAGIYNVVVLKSDERLSFKAFNLTNNKNDINIQYLGSKQMFSHETELDGEKSAQFENSIGFSAGDMIHYIIYSDGMATIVPDSLAISKTVEVEFHECTDEDNRSYKIVKIGGQWWMAENLAYMPEVNSLSEASDSDELYYVYGYNGTDKIEAKEVENYKIYGTLYNWAAALKSCPNGWHLPSDQEWEELAQFISDQKGPYAEAGYYGGWSEIGRHLKSLIGWNTIENNIDDFGFSALPGGFAYMLKKWSMNQPAEFMAIKEFGVWWSSTVCSGDSIWDRRIKDKYADFDRGWFSIPDGLSVRCIKDSEDTVEIQKKWKSLINEKSRLSKLSENETNISPIKLKPIKTDLLGLNIQNLDLVTLNAID